MKFSIFFEMQISEPTRANEAQTFRDCLEQAVLADELGYHCVWEVEHHGLYEYSHSSAPEIFLSFVAARTKRIRIGHGVTLLPYRYNHPIRIAERIATLDILSGGRVNWGSGKSSSLVEQQAFENDLKTLHEQWLEAVEMIPRMWQLGRLLAQGPLLRHPADADHPEAGAAAAPADVRRLHQARSAARRRQARARARSTSPSATTTTCQRRSSEYRAAVAARAARRAARRPLSPARRRRSSRRRSQGLRLRVPRRALLPSRALTRYYLAATGRRASSTLPRDFLAGRDLEAAMARATGRLAGRARSSAIRRARGRRCSASSTSASTSCILVMQMGTVPHELVMESLRTFAEKVMPHFA